MPSCFPGSFNPLEQKSARSELYSRWVQHCHACFGQQLGDNEYGVAWRVLMVQDPIVTNFFSGASTPVEQLFEHFTVQLIVDCLSQWHEFTVNHTFPVKTQYEHCLDSQFAHPCFFQARRLRGVPLTALTSLEPLEPRGRLPSLHSVVTVCFPKHFKRLCPLLCLCPVSTTGHQEGCPSRCVCS